MSGERCGVGKMVKRDSYFVLAKVLHYILIHYLNFLKLKCVYALLVQLKTKIIKKLGQYLSSDQTFIRPTSRKILGIQAGVGVSRLPCGAQQGPLWCHVLSLVGQECVVCQDPGDEFPKSMLPLQCSTQWSGSESNLCHHMPQRY